MFVCNKKLLFRNILLYDFLTELFLSIQGVVIIDALADYLVCHIYTGPGEKMWREHPPPPVTGPHGHSMGPPPPGGGHFGPYPPQGPYPPHQYIMPPPHRQGESFFIAWAYSLKLVAQTHNVNPQSWLAFA